MIKQKNLLLLICSLLFCRFAASGQTVKETYAHALADEAAGNYNAALSQYERIQYFKPDTLTLELSLHIADCRFALKDYAGAYDGYETALLADMHHTLKNEILTRELRAEIMLKNLRYMRLTMKELDTLNDRSAASTYVFYDAVIHFYLEEYDASETCFLKLTSGQPEKQSAIKALFRKNAKINRLKPGIAIALSVVLPGAGQLYAGDWKDGINSLLLNGAMFCMGYQTAVVYNLFNAIVAVGPWYLRYYEGGFTRAGEIVLAKRTAKHNAIYAQLLELIK